MTQKITNIALDKNEYIFGADKKIEVSFEIESDKMIQPKEITIFYGYNFYGNTQKHTGKQEKIILEKSISHKYSFSVPVIFFDITDSSSGYEIKTQNYIEIRLNNSLFSKIKETIIPNIVMKKSHYNFSNIDLSYAFPREDNSQKSTQEKSNVLKEITALISKTDDKKYTILSKEIEKLESQKSELTSGNNDFPEPGKQEEFFDILKKIALYSTRLEKLFIIKEGHKNDYAIINDKIESLNNQYEEEENDAFSSYRTYHNKLNNLLLEQYSCYKATDIEQYHGLINSYFKGLIIEDDPHLNKVLKKISLGNESKNNSGDYIIIKKKFKGAFLGGAYEFFEKNSQSADFVHKDIYDELKKNTVIKLFDTLVNSKVYNFIYKNIYLVIFFSLLGFVFKEIIYDFFPNEKLFIGLLGTLIAGVIFFAFSKGLEKLFSHTINKIIYDYKLMNNNHITKSLENKLLDGTLQIEDIFENLEVKTYQDNTDYNLSVSLCLNIGTHYNSGKNRRDCSHRIYTLKLFDTYGKGHFDLHSIKLLKNNYKELANILLNSNKSDGKKVYYTLIYSFDSTQLPDFDGIQMIYPKFR